MFRGLRLRLTLLYLLAALALIVMVGWGTYELVDNYLRRSTDLALQHRMAESFRTLNLAVPAELAAADANWFQSRGRLPVPVASSPTAQPAGQDHSDGEGDGEGEHNGSQGGSSHQDESEGAAEQHAEDTYDGELAAIYVLPATASGQAVSLPGGTAPAVPVQKEAVAAALQSGSDWRTVGRTRLLTYRLPGNPSGTQPAVLQLGRPLGDQDHVLNQILMGLLWLGGASVLLLGAASWWLAGRSLRPAQQAWERQQSFVANASHELRTPLTLMRASTEVALRGTPPNDPDQRELLQDVLQECDHMGRLVEDLLLLSRLDAGRLVLDRQAVPVREMLDDAERQMGRVAAERGVSLSAHGDGEFVLADPTRLRQVLLVLLDNALRHTPAGGSIWMEARRDGRHVEIAVTDTGSGIPPEHLARVFERFYQADQSHTGASKAGGSGLGLSIARGLVEAQHGHISISSEVGRGTRVAITLPAAEGGRKLKDEGRQALPAGRA